jgi:hypothetical protein
VFEEDHELWGNMEVGDHFEVSVHIVEGRIYEARMGNLMFW